LYDTTDNANDIDIGDTLVQMGFATPTDTTTEESWSASESARTEEVYIPG